jgi:putative endonuclease
VASVVCKRLSENLDGAIITPETLASLSIPGYKFKLQDDILAAFDPAILNY